MAWKGGRRRGGAARGLLALAVACCAAAWFWAAWRAGGWADAGEEGARVVRLGAPLAFTLRKNASATSRVVLSHAVAVERERAVVFFARDAFEGEAEERMFDLPQGFRCVFGAGVATRLRMQYTNTVYYRTSSVWGCELPEGEWDEVRVVGPEGAVEGDGVFPLERGAGPMGDVVACLKNVYDVRESYPALVEYMRYYTQLGVAHFVLYVEAGEPGRELLEALPNATVVVLHDELRRAAFGGNRSAAAPPWAKARLQVFSVNDCVWRTRHRAAWALVQFDLDEYLVGVRSVPAALADVLPDTASVHVPHRLVRPPYRRPLLRPGVEFTNEAVRTWGKSIVRPELIDCMWVHMPTAMRGAYMFSRSMLLLHFQLEHNKKFATQNATKWHWREYPEGLV